MKKNFFLGLVAVLVFVVIGWQIWRAFGDDQSVSADQIREKVQQQYQGEITDIVEMDDRYLVSLLLSSGQYELEISEETGDIIRMDRLEEGEEPDQHTTAERDAVDGRPITQEEAMEIALDRVPGEVDDIDDYTEEQNPYFLIEIETEDDRGEAVLQIHAITGEIMSISWDD